MSYCKCCCLFAEALHMTQFADQVRMRLTLQLINGISGVLQKLLKCFNDTIILKSFVPSSCSIILYHELVIFCLNLNEALLPGKLFTRSLFCLFNAYFADAISKWSTIFKCVLYIVYPSACC